MGVEDRLPDTGLSGLKGMHEQEQRYADDVGTRDGLHRGFWMMPNTAWTQQIIDDLQIDLVYIGQLSVSSILMGRRSSTRWRRMESCAWCTRTTG